MVKINTKNARVVSINFVQKLIWLTFLSPTCLAYIEPSQFDYTASNFVVFCIMETLALTLLFVMLKNGQIHFKNVAVFTP